LTGNLLNDVEYKRRYPFMNKIVYLMVSLWFLISAPLVGAAVNVNITIDVPPPLVFAEPPAMVVIPSGPAYVYMVPGRPGIYFYNNFWYRFHGGHWFWAHIYNGRWAYIEAHLVPRFIIDVPPDYYRHLPPSYHRIPYRDFYGHWYRWDKSRHWDSHEWYKREYRELERRRHAGDLYRDGHMPPPHHYRDLKKQSRGQKRHPDDRKRREQGR
jgi:hypothetical protein